MRYIVRFINILLIIVTVVSVFGLLACSLQFFINGESETLHIYTLKKLAVLAACSIVALLVFRIINNRLGYKRKKPIISAFEDPARFTRRKYVKQS